MLNILQTATAAFQEVFDPARPYRPTEIILFMLYTNRCIVTQQKVRRLLGELTTILIVIKERESKPLEILKLTNQILLD